MATVAQAAKRLGVSERHVRRWLTDGTLRPPENLEDGPIDDDSVEDLYASRATPEGERPLVDALRLAQAGQKLYVEALQRLLDSALQRIAELEKRIADSFDDRERLASAAAEREEERLAAEQKRKLQQVATDKLFDTVETVVGNWMLTKQLEPAKKWAAGFSKEDWKGFVDMAPAELRDLISQLRKDDDDERQTEPGRHSETVPAEHSDGPTTHGDGPQTAPANQG